ncbi:hypothetical protein SADUNF_Sadunf08G0094000 [Salix dunnii]|uniref:Uncharacterized protein n=1 Tax=Salix dunnii TaxID=1413687 RepID=A0A835JXN0_9ROSI|nr:hypothetical protein SADUNF_Sadunf08G0094000 [Salix dunnii]
MAPPVKFDSAKKSVTLFMPVGVFYNGSSFKPWLEKRYAHAWEIIPREKRLANLIGALNKSQKPLSIKCEDAIYNRGYGKNYDPSIRFSSPICELTRLLSSSKAFMLSASKPPLAIRFSGNRAPERFFGNIAPERVCDYPGSTIKCPSNHHLDDLQLNVQI